MTSVGVGAGQQWLASFEASAFSDSLYKPYFQILFGMWHCHCAGLSRVPEVVVASVDSNEFPTIFLQFLYQCSAIHLLPLFFEFGVTITPSGLWIKNYNPSNPGYFL